MKSYKKYHNILLQILIFAILFNTLFLNNTTLFSYGSEYLNFERPFKYYYFENYDQTSALENLCNIAEISSPNTNYFEKVFNFVKSTQKIFLNRKPKQERWEVSSQAWINDNTHDELVKNLKILGFFDDTLPKSKSYDAICILGAAGPTMKSRINFLESLIYEHDISSNNIFLLTGERYLNTKVDFKNDQDRIDLEKHFNKSYEELTERHLFEYLYENSRLNDTFSPNIIDTKQKDGFRPTTQTTVEQFLLSIKDKPEIKKILFISNQPSVGYQNSLITEVVCRCNSEIEFETVGKGCPDTYSIQRIISELGAYIWAATPNVIRKVVSENNIKFSDEEKNIFMENITSLYEHQPLIYQNLLSIIS